MSDVPAALRVLLGLFVLVAAAWDFRTRRIPNWLTASAFAGAVFGQIACSGPTGLWTAAKGLGLALLIALPLYALGATGGGDVKLYAAAAAMTGPQHFLVMFLLNAVLGGIAALAMIAVHRRMKGLTLPRAPVFALAAGVMLGFAP